MRSTYPNYPITFVSRRVACSKASMPSSMSSIATSGTPHNSLPSAKLMPISTVSEASWSANPNAPDTPSPSFSYSASPTSDSFGRPQRLPAAFKANPKIRGIDSSPFFGPTDAPPTNTVHPLRPKMFAFAVPSDW